MFTHCYKGLYINGHADKKQCTVRFASGLPLLGEFKSYRAAQLAITKFLGKCNK